MSAGVLEDAAGNRMVVIGTSEANGYLRRVCARLCNRVRLFVSGTRHAEQNIVAWAQENGYQVISVGAGRPHCPVCVETVTSAGGSTASPRR